MSRAEQTGQKPEAREAGNEGSRRNLPLIIGFATALYWFSLYVYVPILPVYSKDLGASLSMVGLITAAYAIGQILFRIPIGIWADRFGRRKPVVVAGFLFSALGALGLALAPSPWFVFGGRAVTGIAAAAWVAFSVFFAATFPPGKAARAMGLLMFINGASQVVASLAGGYTAQAFGWKATFWAGMATGLVAIPFLLLAPERKETRKPPTLKEIWKVSTVPLLVVVSVLGALGQFSAWALVGFVPVYGEDIGATKGELGLLLMLMYGATSITSLLGIFMGERMGLIRTQVAGFILTAIGCAAIPFTHTVLLLGVTQVIGGFGRGLFFPAQMAISIQPFPQERRAVAMGVFQAVYAIGMFMGPYMSGIIADSLGMSSVFYVAGGVALFCAVASMAPWFVRAVEGTARPAAARPQ